MEFRDLKAQYCKNKSKIDKAIAEVLESTNFINGNQVRDLEEKLAEYVGVKHCVTCANGTDALQLALMVWNIGKNDAVFVPDFTFFSTAEVVALQGATPVFVDVSEETFNISVESLEQAIITTISEGKLEPRAIIAVDLFGQPAEYDRICKLARKYDLLLLEDGAQGFGGSIEERKACSFGDMATTSFFPAKPLGCYGDGGAVFTNSDEWMELLRSYHVHGKGKDKYENIRIGLNSRLDTIQAAVLHVKLDIFKDYELEAVNRVACEYTTQLKEIVQTPVILPGYSSSWAQYSILCKDTNERECIQKSLKYKHIPSMIYYKKPMHMQEVFKNMQDISPVDLAVSEGISKRVLSLPLHPYMTEQEIREITNIIDSVVG